MIGTLYLRSVIIITDFFNLFKLYLSSFIDCDFFQEFVYILLIFWVVKLFYSLIYSRYFL